ncbi:MAG: AraC family transcriptional regulator [Bacteroidaceae bacterium]|nr:AraC family transcriptional regulator [Bacteroidaceae bacterium]MBR1669027.1 AraC family transcriptional regulator [Bacteroidaceae bacterium]
MREENVTILELEGGEINILNAEKDTVKLTKTGLFICKEGEVTIVIDDTEYHLRKNSIIVYFSYSTLHIVSHTPNLRGTLIGANLETIQPMLYNVTNFNALFVIKQVPLQHISDAQFNALCQYITLLKDVTLKEKGESGDTAYSSNKPVIEIARKQAELLSYALMLEVLRCYANVATDNGPFSRKDEVLQKFVSQLYRKYRIQHEVNYYAEQQFLTTRYFSTIVKERSGKSPSQWIATALLVDARNLLKNSNMTIKEISDTLCFPNQSYFGKWFKNLTSLSPLEFRKGKKEKGDEDSTFTDIVKRGISHPYESE